MALCSEAAERGAHRSVRAWSSMLTIRPFQPEDEAGIIALWEEAFPDDPPWNAPKILITRKTGRGDDLLLVGLIRGLPMATVLAGYDGVRGWIYHLAVRKTQRRQGIASRMMVAAEERLKRLGCPKINLQVRAANDDAVAFYRSIGFSVEDRVSMGKRIS
jgi:ribosomal protein S18 acetylase RimI-like enzyme